MFAGAAIYLRQESFKNEQKKAVQIEADVAKKTWTEKRLEAIKQETIAAEQKRIDLENQKKPEMVTVQKKQEVGPKVYSWVNENGNQVFSNQRRKTN